MHKNKQLKDHRAKKLWDPCNLCFVAVKASSVVLKHLELGTGFDSRRDRRKLITFPEERKKKLKGGGRERSIRVL